MRIIINHGGIKREINGPFSIGGTREDLEMMASSIMSYINRSPGLVVGWVDIVSLIPPVPNQSPYDWFQEGRSKQ